jgi:hypothetical protein
MEKEDTGETPINLFCTPNCTLRSLSFQNPNTHSEKGD